MALSRYADRQAVDFIYEILADCRTDVRAVWGAGLSGLDVTAGLEKLTVPTTVVTGTEDRLTPPAVAHRIAETLQVRGSLHRFARFPAPGTARISKCHTRLTPRLNSWRTRPADNRRRGHVSFRR